MKQRNTGNLNREIQGDKTNKYREMKHKYSGKTEQCREMKQTEQNREMKQKNTRN